MDKIIENAINITMNITVMMLRDGLAVNNSTQFVETIYLWAKEFENNYDESSSGDYLGAIDSFAEDKYKSTDPESLGLEPKFLNPVK